MRGLMSVSVFVTVIDRYVDVALRSVQNEPPAVVAVVEGRVIALKPLLVK